MPNRALSFTKYTPGPWREHGKGGCPCGLIFGPDGNVCIAHTYGPSDLRDLVNGPVYVPGGEAQKANARLIAAAPDLYEALFTTMNVLAMSKFEPDEGQPHPMPDYAYDRHRVRGIKSGGLDHRANIVIFAFSALYPRPAYPGLWESHNMTMRAGWTYDGKHFRETYDINNRRVCFIDGKPVARATWQDALAKARLADEHAEQDRLEMRASAARANNFGYW